MWIAFLLSVAPVVVLCMAALDFATAASGLLEPDLILWDNFHAQPGEPLGGCEIVGWRVGTVHVPPIVINTVFFSICLLCALAWYGVLWGIGARRKMTTPTQ